MNQSEQTNELASALAKAQGAMENAPMNRVNPHFRSKYADLASILDTIRKPLSSNGLAVTQQTEFANGAAILRTTLVHTSGQWVATEWPLPVGGRPQEMGSALTYARRYSLSALVGISGDDDDDAEAAQKVAAGPDAPKISKEQATELKRLLGEVGEGEEKFLTYREIRAVEELPAHLYEPSVKILMKKLAEKRAGQGKAG